MRDGRSVGYGYVELTGYAHDPGISGMPDERSGGRTCAGSALSG